MIDVEKVIAVAERAIYIGADKEQLFTANEIQALSSMLREAEKDAARYRRMYDSALREARKQYEWGMEDSECGGNEVMEGLYILECRVIDQAMKERCDE